MRGSGVAPASSHNAKKPTAVAGAIPNTDRRHPFHVALPEGGEVTGFIMVEQVTSIDHRARRATRIGKAPSPILDEVLSILDACIY